MRFVLVEKRMYCHSCFCQAFAGTPDVAVDFVKDSLRGHMGLVKAGYELIDAVSESAVFVVEVFIEGVLLKVSSDDIYPCLLYTSPSPRD